MGNYKNFKAVIYCPVSMVSRATPESLEKEFEFYKRYINPDKVYIEPYRSGEMASREQVLLVKDFFNKHGVETSGGFTTTSSWQNPMPGKEYKKQRIFDTYCYTDKDFRAEVQKAIEYTASFFDEIILDDYYFTNCTCEDCIKAKGNKSWAEYRLALMKDVSENVICKPAKKVNPKCKMVIKFPNWMEGFASAGYNPGEEKDIFDGVYTGTETRNMMDQDQNLPRYLSYSLPRWMENLAPGRNGGGWFDAYQCYPMESYLEQAYLTILSKCREVMIFCWPLCYQHYFIPTLGFQMQQLDALMSHTGNCIGLAEYHPVNAEGEDHLADYLGLLGIPFEPTPNFPENAKSIFFTTASLADKDCMSKLEAYVRKGGHAIVSSGFVQQALILGTGKATSSGYGGNGSRPDGTLPGVNIEQMTSLRYRGRKLSPTHFQYHSNDSWEEYKVTGTKTVLFPLMEHRNNTSWMILKGQTDEKNMPVLIKDTYGLGQMMTFVVPDNFSDLKDLPKPVLTEIRKEFCRDLPLYLDCGKNIGLFLYDNDTFVTYAYDYLNEGPQPCYIYVKGKADYLTDLSNGRKVMPCQTVPENKWFHKEQETVFKIETHPDIFNFWKIQRQN